MLKAPYSGDGSASLIYVKAGAVFSRCSCCVNVPLKAGESNAGCKLLVTLRKCVNIPTRETDRQTDNRQIQTNRQVDIPNDR